MTRSGFITSMSPVVAIWPAVTSPGPVARELEPLGALAFHAQRDLLHVEDDVGDVLAHAGEAREFVQHALDLDRGDGGALQRGEQHAAQRVAERQAEAALERLGDEGRLAAAVAGRLLLERVGLLHFLPVLCVDGHGFPLGSLAEVVSAVRIQTSRCSRGGAREDRQTRRRLDGRTPLCGIGVTSRIEVIWKPTACSARSALSRPEPGPLTSTSSVRTPCSAAFLPASSAATWAA